MLLPVNRLAGELSGVYSCRLKFKYEIMAPLEQGLKSSRVPVAEF